MTHELTPGGVIMEERAFQVAEQQVQRPRGTMELRAFLQMKTLAWLEEHAPSWKSDVILAPGSHK